MAGDRRLAFAYLYLESDDYRNHSPEYREARSDPVSELLVFASGWLGYEEAFGQSPGILPDGLRKPRLDRAEMALGRLDAILMDTEDNKPIHGGEENEGPR